MNTSQVIDKINQSVKIEDVIDVLDFKNSFHSIMKEIHPDTCTLPGAAEAATKLNLYKDYFENGKEYRDDASIIRTNGYWADFKSDMPNINWSIENYRHFKSLSGSHHENFKKYIPKEGKLLADGKFRFEFENRSIPVSGLTLPQEHVNWIFNRLLEYCAYLSENRFVHCGLNPESVFIIPELHGIQICSFYHLTRQGDKIKTISGRYKHWYPNDVFSSKKATSLIDIECAKRIACYLMGSPSGNAVQLRKTHNEKFINFLLESHTNAHETYHAFRKFREKNFKKEFHILSL
jgi:hypothetical protein